MPKKSKKKRKKKQQSNRIFCYKTTDRPNFLFSWLETKE